MEKNLARNEQIGVTPDSLISAPSYALHAGDIADMLKSGNEVWVNGWIKERGIYRIVPTKVAAVHEVETCNGLARISTLGHPTVSVTVGLNQMVAVPNSTPVEAKALDDDGQVLLIEKNGYSCSMPLDLREFIDFLPRQVLCEIETELGTFAARGGGVRGGWALALGAPRVA